MNPKDATEARLHALTEALRESNAMLADLCNVVRDEPRRIITRRLRENRALLEKQSESDRAGR